MLFPILPWKGRTRAVFSGAGMERRTFLRSLGLVALGSTIPLRSKAVALMGAHPKVAPACWVTPQETEGPFYFDPNLVRRDITEGKTGLPFI